MPDELLESVSIPGTDTINFHHIKSYTTGTPEQHSRLDVTKLPFYTYLDHVNTNFVYVSNTIFCRLYRFLLCDINHRTYSNLAVRPHGHLLYHQGI